MNNFGPQGPGKSWDIATSTPSRIRDIRSYFLDPIPARTRSSSLLTHRTMKTTVKHSRRPPTTTDTPNEPGVTVVRRMYTSRRAFATYYTQTFTYPSATTTYTHISPYPACYGWNPYQNSYAISERGLSSLTASVHLTATVDGIATPVPVPVELTTMLFWRGYIVR
jgi:hypothetical protein